MKNFIDGLQDFHIVELFVLTLLFFIFRSTIPKIIEIWFTKERELKDAYLKERYAEEKELYFKLWNIVYDVKVDLDDWDSSSEIAFKLIQDLLNYKRANQPFLHTSICKSIDAIIDSLDSSLEVKGNKLTSDHENIRDPSSIKSKLESGKSGLIESINKRVYRYDT